jgi:hypothetical protein
MPINTAWKAKVKAIASAEETAAQPVRVSIVVSIVETFQPEE